MFEFLYDKPQKQTPVTPKHRALAGGQPTRPRRWGLPYLIDVVQQPFLENMPYSPIVQMRRYDVGGVHLSSGDVKEGDYVKWYNDNTGVEYFGTVIEIAGGKAVILGDDKEVYNIDVEYVLTVTETITTAIYEQEFPYLPRDVVSPLGWIWNLNCFYQINDPAGGKHDEEYVQKLLVELLDKDQKVVSFTTYFYALNNYSIPVVSPTIQLGSTAGPFQFVRTTRTRIKDDVETPTGDSTGRLYLFFGETSTFGAAPDTTGKLKPPPVPIPTPAKILKIQINYTDTTGTETKIADVSEGQTVIYKSDTEIKVTIYPDNGKPYTVISLVGPSFNESESSKKYVSFKPTKPNGEFTGSVNSDARKFTLKPAGITITKQPVNWNGPISGTPSFDTLAISDQPGTIMYEWHMVINGVDSIIRDPSTIPSISFATPDVHARLPYQPLDWDWNFNGYDVHYYCKITCGAVNIQTNNCKVNFTYFKSNTFHSLYYSANCGVTYPNILTENIFGNMLYNYVGKQCFAGTTYRRRMLYTEYYLKAPGVPIPFPFGYKQYSIFKLSIVSYNKNVALEPLQYVTLYLSSTDDMWKFDAPVLGQVAEAKLINGSINTIDVSLDTVLANPNTRVGFLVTTPLEQTGGGLNPSITGKQSVLEIYTGGVEWTAPNI